MATGDKADLLQRLQAVLPPWFGNAGTPILAGVLSGIAGGLSFAHSLIAYARAQTRLGTASDFFLDLASIDFFGGTLPRRRAEADDTFRARIKAAMFPERVTRAAIARVVRELTGAEPRIFEPWNTGDTGGYGVAMGYGVAGAWGSLDLPYRAFIDYTLPDLRGIPGVSGWAGYHGGWGAGALRYSGLEDMPGYLSPGTLGAAVRRNKAFGTLVWMRHAVDVVTPAPPSHDFSAFAAMPGWSATGPGPPGEDFLFSGPCGHGLAWAWGDGSLVHVET